jgi:hypothetical protein
MPTADVAVATPPVVIPERTEEGKWLSGVSGNPAGRPPNKRRSINELQQTLEETVRSRMNPDRIARIVEKMCELAEEGDKKAAQLILTYAIGKPSTVEEAAPTAGVTIRIENATFAKVKEQSQPIEAEYVRVIQHDALPGGSSESV